MLFVERLAGRQIIPSLKGLFKDPEQLYFNPNKQSTPDRFKTKKPILTNRKTHK